MIFLSAGNRCAVDYSSINLPLSKIQIADILSTHGFEEVSVDLVKFARSYIGISRYHRSISIQRAPEIVDCSGFMKWLYAQRGIWLPRYAIQQRSYLAEPVKRDQLRSGDLVFASRKFGLYESDPSDRVGHVGLATGPDSVIHASRERGVCEVPLSVFFKGGVLRGARRVIQDPDHVRTFTFPETKNIESSDDVRWLLIMHLRSHGAPLS